MRVINLTILFFSFCSIIMISCSNDDISKEASGLLIEISNGYNIVGSDIEFYDSSTCILFLKERINFKYRLDEPIDAHFVEYSVFVDDNFIYKGTFYPWLVAAVSPTPNYIACVHMDSINSDVLMFKFVDYPENSVDNRNNRMLIDFYNSENLLRNGISFIVNGVEVSPTNDSVLIIDYTIKNNDEISYLIPDPNKMNKWQISRLSARGGGITNLETNEIIYRNVDINLGDYPTLSINNLSVIEKHTEKHFSIEMPLKSNIYKGYFTSNFMFQNDMNLGYQNLNLNQDKGRIWIGECRFRLDFEVN